MRETLACGNISYNSCCGCGACAALCPVCAIEMKPDAEGFLYPVCNETKCIKCGKCEETCPVIKRSANKTCLNKSFLFHSNDIEQQTKSSSGGFFYITAKKIIEQGGYVCGVVWDDSYSKAYYICSNRLEDIERMRQSKYIQSEKGDIYSIVKAKLDEGHIVLFSGCGCDISALSNVLKKDYDGLYTIELICHGPTSPRYLKEWNDYLSQKYRAPIKRMEMRSKRNNHPTFPFRLYVEFENGKVFRRDFFNTALGMAFSRVQRKSCYDCMVKSAKYHCGDFLIGDAHNHLLEMEGYDDKGTSTVIICSSKGEKLFHSLSEVSVFPVDYEKVVDSIPLISKSQIYSKNRDVFVETEKKHGLVKAADHSAGLVKRLRFHMPEEIVKACDFIRRR